MEAAIRSQILDSVQGRITPYCQFGIGDFDAKRKRMIGRGVCHKESDDQGSECCSGDRWEQQITNQL